MPGARQRALVFGLGAVRRSFTTVLATVIMMLQLALLLTVLSVLTVSCQRSAPASSSESNPELTRLFEEEQAARSGPIDGMDMDALEQQDSLRRQRVRAAASAGELRTARDYYHAAMIFQHGRDSLAYAQAHAWAVQSEALDSSSADARWLVAATWDRYQMSRGQPQWYGTQTDRIPRGTGPVVLYTIDTTGVTDAERVRRGVGTLAQLRARLDSINMRLGYR